MKARNNPSTRFPASWWARDAKNKQESEIQNKMTCSAALLKENDN